MLGLWIKNTVTAPTILCLFLIYTCVFKFVYSMPKARESHLKMSVFSVANMVTGKYIYSVCVLYINCVSSQPFSSPYAFFAK